MKEVKCKGSPYEIGFQHGQEAADEIIRGLVFYGRFFKDSAKMSWPEVCSNASKFEPILNRNWPHYMDEMKGISEGAGIPFLSILAMNVRTEIAYGMASDGCTALSWKTESASYLAQNWDWQVEQQQNLIWIRIQQETKPTIEMITEAGIIGKIGLNSAGVGVCLNAIRANGVDFKKLPTHLALRACLDSKTREEAVSTLERSGVASACHILIADPAGGMGIECSYVDMIKLHMTERHTVTHSNHYVAKHMGVDDKKQVSDSVRRLARINELIEKCGTVKPSVDDIELMFQDEDGYPTAINRAESGPNTSATLFSIIMDLRRGYAEVKMGRPTECEEAFTLKP